MAEQTEAPDDDAFSTANSNLPEQIVGELVTEKVEQATQRAVDRIISASVRFSGPMPPPAMLAGYEKVLPGSADRMLTMAENEQKHRHEIRCTEVRNNNDRARDGQRCALAIAVLFLIGAVWVTLAGYWIAGTILGTVDLVALAGIFVTGKYFSARDENRHARILAEAMRHQHADEDDDE